MSFASDRISLYAHSKNATSSGLDNKQNQVLVNLIKMPSQDYQIDLPKELNDKPNPNLTSSEDLIFLHKNVKKYLSDLEVQTNHIQQFVKNNSVSTKKSELSKLISEIEDFAKKNNIDLNETIKKKKAKQFSDFVSTNLENLKKTSEKGSLNSNINLEWTLSNELEVSEIVAILRHLHILLEKLKKTDSVIGDFQIFKDQSVCSILEEEIEHLHLLDKIEIQKNIKKVEFITADFNKHIGDNKRPYFEMTFRKEILEFLKQFFADFSENKLENVSKVVYNTVNNIEDHSVFLNELSKVIENLSNYQEMLKDSIVQSEENHEALENLFNHTISNLAIKNGNKRILKR